VKERRLRLRWLIALILLTRLASAGDVWIFLKDGRAGTGDPSADPISLQLADKSTVQVARDTIAFQRTREQITAGVTAMFKDIVVAKNVEAHAKRFHVLQQAVVPLALENLKSTDPRYRLAALLALQYGWAPEAETPVVKALDDPDKDVRKAAYAALTKHIQAVRLAEIVKARADSDDLGTATLYFELVDKYYPDASLKRLQRLLRDAASRRVAVTRISHYYSPALTPDTLPLLDDTDVSVCRGGLIGLISQLADSEPARLKVRKVLADPSADLRELASEFFTWLGKADDLPALSTALSAEKDPHTRAALAGAIATIEARAVAWSKDARLPVAFVALRDQEPLEPTLAYGAAEHERQDEFTQRLFRLQEILAARSGILSSSAVYDAGVEFKAAERCVPPVREYFDPQRHSYGVCVSKEYVAFAGSIHIGDDAAWGKALRTVVAIAPGVVRRASHIPSWGFIAVVEHKLPEGEAFCSVYAHLSPLLFVKPGDIVAAGQKIGSVGRSNSVENGGYTAHLHFGIHRGAFSTEGGSWVHGYTSADAWQKNDHGWLDPQEFLKAHAAAAP
jgi:hypothetical protein